MTFVGNLSLFAAATAITEIVFVGLRTVVDVGIK